MVADCWGNSIRMVTRDGLSLATVGGGGEGHQDGRIQVRMSHVPWAECAHASCPLRFPDATDTRAARAALTPHARPIHVLFTPHAWRTRVLRAPAGMLAFGMLAFGRCLWPLSLAGVSLSLAVVALSLAGVSLSLAVVALSLAGVSLSVAVVAFVSLRSSLPVFLCVLCVVFCASYAWCAGDGGVGEGRMGH